MANSNLSHTEGSNSAVVASEAHKNKPEQTNEQDGAQAVERTDALPMLGTYFAS
jgi:hypothetical protein